MYIHTTTWKYLVLDENVFFKTIERELNSVSPETIADLLQKNILLKA